MNIAIGGDHAGFHYKERLIKFLKEKDHHVSDFGPGSDALSIIPIMYTHWLLQ